MNEVNNLTTLQRLQAALQKRNRQNETLQNPEANFEELLKTVEKLERMDNELESVGSEINQVVKQSDIKNTCGVSSGVSKIGNYIKNIEGLVEKLSTGKKAEKMESRYGLTHYSKHVKTGKS